MQWARRAARRLFRESQNRLGFKGLRAVALRLEVPVGVATWLRAGQWTGLVPGRGKRILSSPNGPDRLWAPPNQYGG
jgi:hypothetical protein